MEFTFPAIGLIHSCFREKFGIPRQPGLAPLARGRLELLPPYNDPQALEGLDQASHIWVQFVFHGNRRLEWKPRVKAPRLGGNKTLGVFATRSPVRPAPIGLSVVKLESITRDGDRLFLELSGVDMLDGTPVLDIKPYVPYVDSVPQASNRFAEEPPAHIQVSFSQEAEAQLEARQQPQLRDLIVQILQQDPRPSYQTPEPERVYGMKLGEDNLRWRYRPLAEGGWRIEVVELEAC
jgi:tRNA-Thr(GGU) m(6)t(6)A37 methyltransferase TsaA